MQAQDDILHATYDTVVCFLGSGNQIIASAGQTLGTTSKEESKGFPVLL